MLSFQKWKMLNEAFGGTYTLGLSHPQNLGIRSNAPLSEAGMRRAKKMLGAGGPDMGGGMDGPMGGMDDMPMPKKKKKGGNPFGGGGGPPEDEEMDLDLDDEDLDDEEGLDDEDLDDEDLDDEDEDDEDLDDEDMPDELDDGGDGEGLDDMGDDDEEMPMPKKKGGMGGGMPGMGGMGGGGMGPMGMKYMSKKGMSKKGMSKKGMSKKGMCGNGTSTHGDKSVTKGLDKKWMEKDHGKDCDCPKCEKECKMSSKMSTKKSKKKMREEAAFFDSLAKQMGYNPGQVRYRDGISEYMGEDFLIEPKAKERLYDSPEPGQPGFSPDAGLPSFEEWSRKYLGDTGRKRCRR